MPLTDCLITLEDAKASLGITVTTYDADLEQYIKAATLIVERKTGPLIQRNLSYTFDGGSSCLVLPHAFSAVVTLTVDDVAFTEYIARPASGTIYAGTTDGLETFEDGIQNVDVTVTVGVADTAYPANVKLAAREIVRHWWQQGRQGNRPSFGNEAADAASILPLGVSRRIDELLAPNDGMPGFA